MNFKEFFESTSYPIKMLSPLTMATPAMPFGALPSTGVNTTTPGNPVAPSPSTDFDLGLPSRTVTSPIWNIEKVGRLWKIQLKNDTISMTEDEFRRIKGNPKIGRIATVVLQTQVADSSQNWNQVQSFSVQ